MKGFFFILILIWNICPAQDAADIIRKAEEKYRGKSSAYSEMTISTVRPKWTREMTLKSWSKGNELSLILVTAPASDKGTAFLKRNKEVWNWIPSIDRSIKLPPSMMMQSWMGTDLTNDDLVRESSILEDYTHKLSGDSTLLSRKCWKIILTPKPDAPVVWGKVVSFIDKTDYLQLRAEYYDEDGYLISVMNGSDIKTLGGQIVTSTWEMIPMDKKGHKTIIHFNNMTFNDPITEDFFTTQNMRKVR